MNGQELFDAIQRAYDYLSPRLLPSNTTSTAPYQPPFPPSLSHLPAFLVHDPALVPNLLSFLVSTLDNHLATGEVDRKALTSLLRIKQEQVELSPQWRNFDGEGIANEGDVTRIAGGITRDLATIIRHGYKEDLVASDQVSLVDQRPDRILHRRGSKTVIWEDKGWKPFDTHAPTLVDLARLPSSRHLVYNPVRERNERAILYKIAIAMARTDSYWGLLFGGHKALVFHRIQHPESLRYGVVCSNVIDIQHILMVVLGMLLVPRSAVLVDLKPFAIPVPTPAPAVQPSSDLVTRARAQRLTLGLGTIEDDRVGQGVADGTMNVVTAQVLHLIFSIPDFEYSTLSLSRSSNKTSPTIPQSPPNSPLPLTPSVALQYPSSKLKEVNFVTSGTPIVNGDSTAFLEEEITLLITETPFIGATGMVFKAIAGPLALVVKAVPPNGQGEGHLRHEVRIYEALASLQGSIIPKMVGCFEGGGWTVFVAEDCGSALTDDTISLLSAEQKETLWHHACSIHRNHVYHGDLEPRNLVVSDSGAFRIIDFAYSELEHDCNEATCSDLRRFRKLLEPV